MKTLVIHPDDHSTDFLKGIYQDLSEKTVVTGEKRKDEIIELIKSHDRVMMMGHGSPGGLFKAGAFPRYDGFYLIDKSLVPYLKDKDNFYIWCHADQFVQSHNLKGFYSGMFVSEPGEAVHCNLAKRQDCFGTDLHKMVRESNDIFSKLVGLALSEEMPLDDLYEYVRDNYGEVAKTNSVAKYNHERLYKVG